MFLWLSLGFIVLIALWVACCTALDMLEEHDRKKERSNVHYLTDRLVKYQERDY